MNSTKFFAVAILLLFLLPASTFAQDTTWFKDVSTKLGFNVMYAESMIGLDVNNDDFPDLITFSSNPDVFPFASNWRLFINEQKPGSTDRIFVDHTTGSGLEPSQVEIKDMACAADFNNDGNIDLVTNCWYFDSTENFQNGTCANNPDNGSRLHLLLGDGHGHFTLKQNSGLEDLGPMSGTALLTLDYDLDGNLDLFVGTQYNSYCIQKPTPSYLVKGKGDGTFEKVESSGINVSQKDPAKPWFNPPTYRAMYSANIADWNNDCYPDILTCPYEANGYPFYAINGQYPTAADTEDTKGYGNLYQNNGNGTFTDVGVTANYDPHFTWGNFGQGMVPWAALPCDYNNDGNIDFLVLEVHGGSNPGEGKSTIFTNQGPAQNYTLMPDLNQIVRQVPQNIHHGDHNGFWSDFDNDGWVDLVVGDSRYVINGYPDANRMTMCRQDPSTHIFTDITRKLGFVLNASATSINDKIRRPAVMIPMDYDMDGDNDIFKTASTNTDSLEFLVLRNDIANKSNHIEIKLLAPEHVNKSCIGARVTVKAGGIKQMREIYGNQGSFSNEYPLTLNFGIGQSTIIDSIDVRWPDASCSHTVVTNVQPNQFIYIDASGINAVRNVFAADNLFQLYPNPVADGPVTLKFKNNNFSRVEIYNSLGEKLSSYRLSAGSTEFQLPVNKLAPGTYWVHVVGASGNGLLAKPFVRIAAH